MKTILVQSSTLQVFSNYINQSTNWYESFCMFPDNAINQYVAISKLHMDVFIMEVDAIDQWLDLNLKQFIIPIKTLNDMKVIVYIDILMVCRVMLKACLVRLGWCRIWSCVYAFCLVISVKPDF